MPTQNTVVAEFDPDAYLQSASLDFDPDAYLGIKPKQQTGSTFVEKLRSAGKHLVKGQVVHDKIEQFRNETVTPEYSNTNTEVPTSNWLGDMGKRAGRSLVKMPGQVVEGVGNLADAVGRMATVAGADELQQGGTTEQRLGSIAEAFRTPTPGTTIVKDTGRQMSKSLGSLYENKNVPGMEPDPARNQELLAQAADSLGSLAGAMVTPGGVLPKTIIGAILNSQGQADEARQILEKKGRSAAEIENESLRQFVLNIPAGGLEAVPWFNALRRFGGTNIANAISEKWGKTALRRISGALFGQAALEAGEEGLQQIWGNAAATTYDPNRPVTQGVGTAMAVGGLLGGGLGGGAQVTAESINSLLPYLPQKAPVPSINRPGGAPAEEGGQISPEPIQPIPANYQTTEANTIPIQGATAIPVRSTPGGSEGVRVENAVAQETTGARLIEEAAQGAKSVPAVAAPTAAGTPAAPGTHVMPDGSVMADAEMAAPAAAAPVQQSVAPVAAPPASEPAAKATEQGPVIAATPSQERAVSKLSDKKQFKVQKEFLGDAIKKAIAEAPDEATGKLTIEIPGDGTYSVLNDKPSLKRFAEVVEKRFGKTWTMPKPSDWGREKAPVNYSPFSEPASSTSAPKATAIPAVKTKPTPEDLGKAAEMAVSSRPDRKVLHHVLSDDGFAVATDGRRMIVVAGGKGLTPDEIVKAVVKSSPNETAVKYPNWRQVWPEWVKAKGGQISVSKKAPGVPFTLDTSATAKMLNQALAVVGDAKIVGAKVHDIGGGKIGVTANHPDVGEYESEGAGGEKRLLAALPPNLLRDVMLAARMAGHESVKMWVTSDDKPAVVVGGDNFAAIIMPMRLDGPVRKMASDVVASDEKQRVADGTKRVGDTAKRESGSSGAIASIGRVGSPPAPPAPVGPNPADYPPNPSPVDDPVFTQLPIQLPEMLEFYKAITGGKIPRIVESISRRGGEASGVFRYKEGTPDSGTIELRADLFRLLSQAEKNKLMGEAVAWATLMKEANPSMNLHEAIKSKFNELVKAAELEALKRDPVHAMHVFAHEIWHQVDFLPDATLKRGNILGHLATFKRYLWGYLDSHPGLMRDPDAKPFPTTPELNALRQQAKKELDDAVKEIVETIKREVPIYNELPVTADHITSILKNAQRDEFPDLYDWFQVQDRATKVAVLRAAMKGLVDERAARFASRKQVGTQTVEETITRRSGPEPTPEKIRERFEELLREELRQRGLVSERDIRRELQSAIAWWQGVQVMPPYFSSAVEMFAEAGSMFLNNPAALEKRAPIFYQTLVNYIQRKPEIEKAYLKVQDDIRAGVLMPKRVQGLFESWRTDSAAGLARDLEFNKLDWKALKATFNLAFNKHQWPAQVLAQKLIGDPKADKLLGSLQDYLYRQTAVEGLARQVNMRVEKPLHDNNLKHEDISELMFHNRIVHGDAQQTANSRGWSPNTSTQRLAEMQANLGPQRWNVLRGALEALRSIYEEGPIKLLEVSGALDPKLMAFIKENIHYSPFQKAREAFNPLTESTIEGMIDAAYGEGIGAKIFHRRGYLGDIQSPYVAMLKKAESLTKFAYKQIAINAFVDFKLAHDPDGIKEADKKFNGKIMAPVEIDSQKIGTIFRMRGGVVDGFYVPRAEYEAFENASGIEQMLIGVATYPLSFFRSVLTELNAGIWPVLLVRDLGALAIQMPGGMRQLLKPGTIPRNYQTAKASFTSKPNPAADTLLKRLMVISKADPRGDWVGIKDETDRWLLRMSKYPEVWDQEMRKISRFINWWEWYKTQGQIFERTSKAIGQEVVDSDMWRWPTTPEWMKQKFVTELSGSPNFLARGRDISVLETFTGNIFVNAMMRGYEAMHTAAKLDPKGFWTKFMLSIGFSSMAVFSFIQGWTDFGMDPEEAEDQREKYRSIPEFSKLQGWVIPLFWVNKEQKQVLYLTVPFPDSMRILHAGLRKLMQTAVSQDAGNMGLSSLTQYGGTQLPGTNPLFTAGSEWWQYAVQGRNPYDPFRGKQVLDDTVFTAGKGAADLASRTAANLTGGMFFRYQQTIPGKTKSDIEKLLTWGPVANIFGRWLKISNAGIHEENQAALEPNKTERAELQLVAQELMRKNSEGEDWTENERLLVSVKPYIIEYMRNRFKDVAAQSQGPEMLDFRRGNREQRRILVETWGKREQVKEARRLRGEPELERVPDDSIPKSPPPPAPPPNEKPLSQYQEGAIYRDKVTGVSRRYRQGQFV